MIKQAEVQNAYVLGRQAAMEKIALSAATTETLGELSRPLVAGSLFNSLGTMTSDNKRAKMDVAGVLAPLGYQTVGYLGATGLGHALRAAYSDPNSEDAIKTFRLAQLLGKHAGRGYGSYRAFKRPGEM